MTATTAPELRLSPAQPPRELSDEQLQHFAQHGWVIQEDAFTPEECALFREALDRLDAQKYCPDCTHRERERERERHTLCVCRLHTHCVCAGCTHTHTHTH